MHQQALHFDRLAFFRGRRRPLPPAAWSGVGALAIPLWATWPTLAVWASALPAFEVLTIAFTVGWLMLTWIEGRREKLDSLPERRPSALPVAVCALGLCGSNAGFILATASIPAAQANLIAYLWPVMVVALGGVFGLFRLRTRHAAGVGLGFAGAGIVLGGTSMMGALPGIALALLSGASWAAYCLFRLWQGPAATTVLGRGCGLSAGVCAALHLVTETTVLPGFGTLVAALAIGLGPLALANLAWDQGLRRGNGPLLAVMAFATPLVGALILIAAGIATATTNLLVGAVVIVLAGLLSAGDGGRDRA